MLESRCPSIEVANRSGGNQIERTAFQEGAALALRRILPVPRSNVARDAGDFAHVRWSANETKDPYSDVVVHEAAHLPHYLKPEHYGLPVRRGQERFVDVEFRHRELFAFACEAHSRVVFHNERKSRISFAQKMQADAFSFPRSHIEEVAALVLNAGCARNGWRVIRGATVIHGIRRRVKTVT